MPQSVERRREFLINIAFLAVILALIYVFFKYLFWITAPFLLTFLLAIALQKPLRKIDKKTNKKGHTFFSIFLVIITTLIVLIPLILIISAAVSKISDFVKYLTSQLNDIPTFLATLEKEILDFAKFLPDGVYKSFSETISNVFDSLIEDFSLSSLGISFSSISSTVTSGLSGVFGVLKNIPSVLIGIVIGIIAWIFFTKDYNYIVRFIQKQLPEGKKNMLVEIKQVFSKTILKMVRAYALIMLITFFELFLGFSILSLLGIMKNSYFVFIAALIAIFDILPIAGSGGILIPWALFSLVMGNFKQAIGLIIMYVVITFIRQYIEPKIVGDTLGVHPLVTLMGLYFGLKLFGFMGMFIVPLTVMTLKVFNDTGRIQLWKPVDRK
ncbi:MAG: sporulation integral membrane protein YtvI [Ruminococcaceae bacterium]|nr:sporulation integral membrane protein YtvI [Oscillospiraceae bacterium]